MIAGSLVPYNVAEVTLFCKGDLKWQVLDR